jgi:hypothetical protein
VFPGFIVETAANVAKNTAVVRQRCGMLEVYSKKPWQAATKYARAQVKAALKDLTRRD